MHRWLSTVFIALLVTGDTACAGVSYLPEAKSVEDVADRGLGIRWFGASTITVSDGETTIMIDGFFSRPGIVRLGLAWAGLPLVRQNDENLKYGLDLLGSDPIHSIFVAHAHHDHVLDTAIVADIKGATVYGSKSVEYVVLTQRPNVAFHEITDGSEISCADTKFSVKVFASAHKPTIFGPSGEIDAPLTLPGNLRAFRSGPSFAFLVSHPKGTVLIVPSAVIEGDPPNLAEVEADVVLLGVGLLGRAPKATMTHYWTSIVRATKAARVHPIHWDNFMRPLTEPPTPIPFDRLAESIRTLKSIACQDHVEFSYLPIAATTYLPLNRQMRAKTANCPQYRPP